MSKPAKIFDYEIQIRTDMDNWAKYRRQTSDIDLGYPKQSAEQMSGYIKGTGDKFEPDLDMNMKIDRAVNDLHADLRKVIYCRYAIPLELSDLVELNIPIVIMTKSQSAYFWSEDFNRCVYKIGLNRHVFDGHLRHAIGKIEGKIYE